jgi:hypothetical protein
MPTPSAPNGGGFMYGSPTTLYICWSVPEDDGGAPITTYMVCLTPDGQSTVEHLVEGSSQYYSDNSLVHGINVQASVKASNDGGQSYGPEFIFPLIVPVAAPPVPTFPAAVADGPGIATISWQPPETPPEGVGYYLVTSVSSNPSDIPIGYGTADMTELSCTLTGLNPQSEYSFTVEVVNQVGHSPAATTNTIVFPSPPTEPPPAEEPPAEEPPAEEPPAEEPPAEEPPAEEPPAEEPPAEV